MARISLCVAIDKEYRSRHRAPYNTPSLCVAKLMVKGTGLIVRADSVLQILYAWQLVSQIRRERARDAILAHAHRLGDVLQRILRYKIILRFAQQKPDRRVVRSVFNMPSTAER